MFEKCRMGNFRGQLLHAYLNVYSVPTIRLDVSWLKGFNCDKSYSCLRQCFKYPTKRVSCYRGEVSLNCSMLP